MCVCVCVNETCVEKEQNLQNCCLFCQSSGFNNDNDDDYDNPLLLRPHIYLKKGGAVVSK